MTAATLDRSPEAAQDALQAARLAFLAAPCQGSAEPYRRASFRFWKARNRSSAGFDEELAKLDQMIAAKIAEAEDVL